MRNDGAHTPAPAGPPTAARPGRRPRPSARHAKAGACDLHGLPRLATAPRPPTQRPGWRRGRYPPGPR